MLTQIWELAGSEPLDARKVESILSLQGERYHRDLDYAPNERLRAETAVGQVNLTSIMWELTLRLNHKALQGIPGLPDQRLQLRVCVPPHPGDVAISIKGLFPLKEAVS